jgi:hypothetical protein
MKKTIAIVATIVAVTIAALNTSSNVNGSITWETENVKAGTHMTTNEAAGTLWTTTETAGTLWTVGTEIAGHNI